MTRAAQSHQMVCVFETPVLNNIKHNFSTLKIIKDIGFGVPKVSSGDPKVGRGMLILMYNIMEKNRWRNIGIGNKVYVSTQLW